MVKAKEMEMWILLFLCLCSCCFVSAELSSSATAGAFTVLNSVEHDEKCFTQGLVLHASKLYESCGLYGKSSLRIVDAASGQVLTRRKIDRKYFAEGIVLHAGKIFMLTWKSRTMLVFDADSLQKVGTMSYMTSNGQGWGITCDGSNFIASDGSSFLTFFDLPAPGDSELTVSKRVSVVDPATGTAVSNINELQFVKGYVYANVWYKDVILKIDPRAGYIVQKFDMLALYPHHLRTRHADCLNGIAFDENDNSFLLTGKLWPRYYKTHLHDQTAASLPSTGIERVLFTEEQPNSLERIEERGEEKASLSPLGKSQTDVGGVCSED